MRQHRKNLHSSGKFENNGEKSAQTRAFRGICLNITKRRILLLLQAQASWVCMQNERTKERKVMKTRFMKSLKISFLDLVSQDIRCDSESNVPVSDL